MAPRTVARLTPEDAAYLAGLIDGEGSIALSRLHSNANRQLVVTISNTEKPLLVWVRATIGVGKITTKAVYSVRHAPAFAYTVANRQALALLRQVAPFLRTYKRQRADLVLSRYLELTPRNGRYSLAQRQARQTFEEDFATISVRGRGHVPLPSSSAPSA